MHTFINPSSQPSRIHDDTFESQTLSRAKPRSEDVILALLGAMGVMPPPCG
jgi:hypothetical protein